MTCSEWQNMGSYETVLDNNIFVIDKGTSDKTIAILHGYPTSSYDFYKVIDYLSSRYRIILHDHLGFGYSDKPTYETYSLMNQADIAEKLWIKLKIKEVIVLAHNYGTSIATELIARQNENKLSIKITNFILCNGSIHIEMAQLRLIQRLLKSKLFGPTVAKFASYKTFSTNMKNVFYDNTKVTEDELQDMWYLLTLNEGKLLLPKLTQYINERYLYWDRWIGALKETELIISIVWATEDPVAVKKIAFQLESEIQNSRLFLLHKTGHFPMLENPKHWCDLIDRAIDCFEA